MTAQVLWLGEPAACEQDLVGGKAANLSRLAASRPVPAGFCVTGDSPEAMTDGATTRSIETAYRELSERAGESRAQVAVRSSAVDEDGDEASFAGLNETYLNITGASEVVAAIRECVASFGSERALAYRREQGLQSAPERFAVLVQRLVTADVSGVAFSADPVSGDRNTVVVNASWGLGESVVGGTVTPDSYAVERSSWAVVSRQTAAKERMTVCVPGGVREVTVPRQLRSAPALTEEEAVSTARMAAGLETYLGRPADIEFAWAAGNLYLLQCRPVTTLTEDDAAERQMTGGVR